MYRGLEAISPCLHGAASALVKLGDHWVRAATDAREAACFPFHDVPSLAFDHAEIVGKALARLRGKLWRRFLAARPNAIQRTFQKDAVRSINQNAPRIPIE